VNIREVFTRHCFPGDDAEVSAIAIRQEVLQFKQILAAEGRLADVFCIYCAYGDDVHALRAAKCEIPRLYSRIDCQVFHCGNQQHAKRLHRLCQLTDKMRWHCCDAVVDNRYSQPDPLKAYMRHFVCVRSLSSEEDAASSELSDSKPEARRNNRR
jgi:hypothetical protein